MNRITKAEREALYRKAQGLLLTGLDRIEAEVQLERDGVSTQRARHAVAVARLRMNRPYSPTT